MIHRDGQVSQPHGMCTRVPGYHTVTVDSVMQCFRNAQGIVQAKALAAEGPKDYRKDKAGGDGQVMTW